MTTTKLLAPDIMCDGCAASIRKILTPVEGISEVTIDVAAKTVTVTHDIDLASIPAIQTRLDHAGFPASVSVE
jgi:copper chaperone